jgi:hypothetical protein
MTLADQAAAAGHDGQVTSGKPGRPRRRTFTLAYKARIVAAFDELPEGSPGRGELLRPTCSYQAPDQLFQVGTIPFIFCQRRANIGSGPLNQAASLPAP